MARGAHERSEGGWDAGASRKGERPRTRRHSHTRACRIRASCRGPIRHRTCAITCLCPPPPTPTPTPPGALKHPYCAVCGVCARADRSHGRVLQRETRAGGQEGEAGAREGRERRDMHGCECLVPLPIWKRKLALAMHLPLAHERGRRGVERFCVREQRERLVRIAIRPRCDATGRSDSRTRTPTGRRRRLKRPTRYPQLLTAAFIR